MTALQKPTQESVVASIVRVQYHHWEDTQFVSCLVERDDGFHAHGFHNPIDPADFDMEESRRLAFAGAVATLYGLAVSGFFERRAMLAGAHDVLDRCGVGGEDLNAPAAISLAPEATRAHVEELQRILADGKGAQMTVMPAPANNVTAAPAIGDAVIIRCRKGNGTFRTGTELTGVVVQPSYGQRVEIAAWFPMPVGEIACMTAESWSELDVVTRPLTEVEEVRVSAIRRKLAEASDHAHA